MEKFPRTEALPNNQESIEREANFEGNETEILISRLRNPVIKGQLIDIFYQEKVDRLNFLKQEQWEAHLPEGWTGEERFKLLKGKNSGKIINTEDLDIELSLPELTREEIEEGLDKDIDQIERTTKINFTADGPTSSVIPLGWRIPWSGEKPTSKQMSIIEAHEKGHQIRSYYHLTERFKEAFDISKVDFTEEDFDVLKRDRENQTNRPINTQPELTLEEARDQYLSHLFTAMEIAERMSQLKNYFGFKGDEKFTSKHLHYAREHYVNDTDMDNGMKLFFQAITPETEDAFLEIINNSGI